MAELHENVSNAEKIYKNEYASFRKLLQLCLNYKKSNYQVADSKQREKILHDLEEHLTNVMIEYDNYLDKFNYIFLRDLDADSRELINAYINCQTEYRNIIQDDYHLAHDSVAGTLSMYGKQAKVNVQDKLIYYQVKTQAQFLEYNKVQRKLKYHVISKISNYMAKYTRTYNLFIGQLINNNLDKKRMQNQLLRNNLEYYAMISDYTQIIKYINTVPKKLVQTKILTASDLVLKPTNTDYLNNASQERVFSDINNNIKDLVFPIKPYMPTKNGAVNYDLVDVVQYYLQDVIYVIMVNVIDKFNKTNGEKLVVTGGNAWSKMYNLNNCKKSFDWDLHIIEETERDIEKIMAIISGYLNDHIVIYEMFRIYLNNAIANINNYFKIRNIVFVIQPYTNQTISLLPNESIFTHYSRGAGINSHKIQFICNNIIQHVDITDIEYDYFFKIGDIDIRQEDCYKVGNMLYISITHIVRSLVQLACGNSKYRKLRQVLGKIFFLKKNLLRDVFDCSFLKHLQTTDELSRFSTSVIAYMNSKHSSCSVNSGDFVEKSIMYICQNIEEITQDNYCKDIFLSTNFDDVDHVPEFLFAMIHDSNEYLIDKCKLYHTKHECNILEKLILDYTDDSAPLNNSLTKYYYTKDASILQKSYFGQTVKEYTQNMNRAMQIYHGYNKFQQYYDRTITIYKSCHFFNLPVVGQDSHEISAGDNIYQPCFNSASYSKGLNYVAYMHAALPFYIMEITLQLDSPFYMILDQSSMIRYEKEILLKNDIVFHVDRVSNKYVENKNGIRNVKVLHISITEPRNNLEYINNRVIQIDDRNSDGDPDKWLNKHDRYISNIMVARNPALLHHNSTTQSTRTLPEIVADSMQQHFVPAPRAIAAFRAYRKAKSEYKQQKM